VKAINWRLIGDGQGINWEDMDKDISIEDLLAGNPSGESPTACSFGTKNLFNGSPPHYMSKRTE
jgi:hypothetical protein